LRSLFFAARLNLSSGQKKKKKKERKKEEKKSFFIIWKISRLKYYTVIKFSRVFYLNRFVSRAFQ